jgi:hypothetical protein
MLYELRTYDTVPGKLPALLERFDKGVVNFFDKHGIGMLGFWTDEVGVSNRLTYIVTAENMGDREAKWDALQGDPEWQGFRRKGDQKEGAVVDRIQNTFMTLARYSPEPKITTNLQELRIYEAMPGKMAALHDRFDHAVRFLRKYGFGEVGYWTDAVGSTYQLWWMLSFPDMADREKKWAAFRQDAEWQNIVAESHKDGILVRKAYNTFLVPTAFSPRG